MPVTLGIPSTIPRPRNGLVSHKTAFAAAWGMSGGDGDLVHLKEAVMRIIDRAMVLLDDTPLLARQKLVSPDPVKR
jgi:hypothetical protein